MMPGDREFTAVSRTAIAVALMRALESERPDHLFDDPYARALVRAAPEYGGGTSPEIDQRIRDLESGRGPLATRLARQVVVRTRFFDGYLLDATSAGCRQVVLVAAGLDARAYRLDFARGVRLFELDLPAVLAFKDRVLATARPTGDRIAVPVDLREDWPEPLRQAGFDPGTRTAWLIEGLLVYLSRAEAAALLTTVLNLSAPGSQVSFEQSPSTIRPGVLTRLRRMGPFRSVPRLRSVPQLGSVTQLRSVTELWKGGLGEDAGRWLERRGWSTRRFNRSALSTAYGRPDPTPDDGEFLIATRG